MKRRRVVSKKLIQDNDDDTVEVPFHGLTKLKVRVGADGMV